jgi:diguanylate cyclase (GGDEF)-like protein
MDLSSRRPALRANAADPKCGMNAELQMGRNADFSERRYLAGMERLIGVVQELSLARDLATIQRIVRTTARELTGADGATFVLRDNGYCYYADEDAISPLWKGRRFPIQTCISGWAMLNRKPAVIEDIYRDARIPHEAYRPTFVKSLAMVPIRTLDPVGAIGNYWAAIRQPSEQEVRLLQALADSTAVAMENQQVYQELEQRVEARTAELQAANEEIRNLSLTDELTGLRNRRGFLLFADQARRLAMRAGKQAAIVYADVDGLKTVNERQGHGAGDALLRNFAGLLTNTFRESDVIARVGGDEFCVFGAELDLDPDVLVARLEYNIARFNAEHPGSFPLAASAGVWRCPFKGEQTLEELIAHADEAMYASKRARRQIG